MKIDIKQQYNDYIEYAITLGYSLQEAIYLTKRHLFRTYDNVTCILHLKTGGVGVSLLEREYH